MARKPKQDEKVQAQGMMIPVEGHIALLQFFQETTGVPLKITRPLHDMLLNAKPIAFDPEDLEGDGDDGGGDGDGDGKPSGDSIPRVQTN